MNTRTHPIVPSRFDFHLCLLWIRSLEEVVGSSRGLVLEELEMAELFGRYRSPWRA